MANDDDQGAIEEFREAVNMTAKELTD